MQTIKQPLFRFITNFLTINTSIGPWKSNPNSAANKNRILYFARNAAKGTGTIPSTKTSTGMGPIGYLTNGKIIKKNLIHKLFNL